MGAIAFSTVAAFSAMVIPLNKEILFGHCDKRFNVMGMLCYQNSHSGSAVWPNLLPSNLCYLSSSIDPQDTQKSLLCFVYIQNIFWVHLNNCTILFNNTKLDVE